VALCTFCKTETDLYEGRTPLCVKCADLTPALRGIRAELFRHLSESIKRADAAGDAFFRMTLNVPSGIPHPDGIQRIRNASRELKAAREELMKSHHRLNDFLNTGIVPEDLKRSG